MITIMCTEHFVIKDVKESTRKIKVSILITESKMKQYIYKMMTMMLVMI